MQDLNVWAAQKKKSIKLSDYYQYKVSNIKKKLSIGQKVLCLCDKGGSSPVGVFLIWTGDVFIYP